VSLITDISNYKPQDEREARDKKVFLECLRLFPQNILLRENEIAHVTSSGFIVNKALDQVLLAHHNIMNRWAWTGGHADGNEDLLAVAVQEALEETGLHTVPLTSEIASIDILTVSNHFKKGIYVNSHLHLSVAYLLVADDKAPLVVKPDENSGVKWFPAAEISSNQDLFREWDVYLYGKLLRRARDFRGV
jgi:8-oxo-dGTP pyrophosphatase MutT (NUDIX family)